MNNPFKRPIADTDDSTVGENSAGETRTVVPRAGVKDRVMENTSEIRRAREADAADIAELIYSSSLACCFSPEQPCPDWYRESMHASQIATLLKSEEMLWLLAVQDQKLTGVLAIRDRSHVKYFFVDPAYQRLGIGKQLWQFALQNDGLGNSLTVRSSLFAVPVYQRLGFKAVEPPKTRNGMHYQTMTACRGQPAAAADREKALPLAIR